MDLVEEYYEFLKQRKERALTPGVYHVSSLVQPCLRNIYYTYMVPKPLNPVTLSLFQMGTSTHEMIQSMFSRRFLVQLEVPVYKQLAKDVGLSGHIDMVVFDAQKTKLLPVEIKTFSRLSYNTGPLEHHVDQLMLYMFLGDFKEGLLFYHCRTIGEVKQYEVQYRQDLVDKLIEKTFLIHQYLLRGFLPPKAEGWKCRYCNYREECGADAVKLRKVILEAEERDGI